MKNVLAWFLVAAALCATLHAQTDDYVILDKRADDFDHWQERLDYTYGTTAISKETNVPLVVLEQQRTQAHLGYGGLMLANALALETGKGFDEIAALKRGGTGWGRIARENNVELGRIVSRLDRVEGEFRQAEIKGDHSEAEVGSKEAKSGRDGDKHTRGQGQSKARVKSPVKSKASTSTRTGSRRAEPRQDLDQSRAR